MSDLRKLKMLRDAATAKRELNKLAAAAADRTVSSSGASGIASSIVASASPSSNLTKKLPELVQKKARDKTQEITSLHLEFRPNDTITTHSCSPSKGEIEDFPSPSPSSTASSIRPQTTDPNLEHGHRQGTAVLNAAGDISETRPSRSHNPHQPLLNETPFSSLSRDSSSSAFSLLDPSIRALQQPEPVPINETAVISKKVETHSHEGRRLATGDTADSDTTGILQHTLNHRPIQNPQIDSLVPTDTEILRKEESESLSQGRENPTTSQSPIRVLSPKNPKGRRNATTDIPDTTMRNEVSDTALETILNHNREAAPAYVKAEITDTASATGDVASRVGPRADIFNIYPTTTTEVHVHTGGGCGDNREIGGDAALLGMTTALEPMSQAGSHPRHSANDAAVVAQEAIHESINGIGTILRSISGTVALLVRVTLLKLLISLLYYLINLFPFLIIGFYTCQTPYAKYFSICHAKATNPLCAIVPYAPSILAFCPGDNVVVIVSPRLDVKGAGAESVRTTAEPFVEIMRLSEDHTHMPVVLQDYQKRMKRYYWDTMKIAHSEANAAVGSLPAEELLSFINDYCEALDPATSSLDRLNSRIWGLGLKVKASIETLEHRIALLEEQTPWQQFWGWGKVDPSAREYYDYWNHFLDNIRAPAKQLKAQAMHLRHEFSELKNRLYHIEYLAKRMQDGPERTRMSIAAQAKAYTHKWAAWMHIGLRNALTRLREEEADALQTLQLFQDVEDACTESENILDSIQDQMQAALKGADVISEKLEESLRSGDLKWQVDTEIRALREAVARMVRLETVAEDRRRNEREQLAKTSKEWESRDRSRWRMDNA